MKGVTRTVLTVAIVSLIARSSAADFPPYNPHHPSWAPVPSPRRAIPPAPILPDAALARIEQQNEREGLAQQLPIDLEWGLP